MATSRPKKDAPLGTYRVLSPLDHDQVQYAPGESVELTDEAAKPLLDLRAVERTEPTQAPAA